MSARPRAFVLVTGSELVRGGRRDENGPFLARQLTRLGLEPARVVTVGDGADELAAALREGLEADLCVISGGLGPTHDDRTIELLAQAADRRLLVDSELEREIEAVSRRGAARIGRAYADFSAGVRKQASIPEGGVSLGLAGTAPAVLLEHDGSVAVALPGPPGELQRLWPAALASDPVQGLLARVERPDQRILRFFGPSESAVARALVEAGGELPGLDVTVCAHDLEIAVDVFVAAGREREADSLVDALRNRFGGDLFALDQRSAAEIVLDLCRVRRLTLATAESCTGGLVGARLTAVPGSSDVYVGGVVAYADAVKARQLRVPEEVLERHGAVSAETAAAMAAGARVEFGANLAVSVTGIAGPGGATPEKPVGLVFCHAEAPDGELSLRIELPGGREEVRERATVAALHLVRRLLTQRTDTHA
ncbi:MAG: nicotinamide-nucleotide amidohydrolase family protein [Actinomycetota bacterium]|nr:nicotinamide-nucleotide amidohydrolase family protein [Actinomycetota bacterium]